MKTSKTHYRVPVENHSGLHAYVAQPLSDLHKTLFVFSHGFTVDGTESFRLFIQLSEKLLSLGYPSILFDYRGNGYSDLAFEDMTFDTLMEDLDAITDFARGKFPESQIAYWGMSFGCAVASSVAAKRKDVSFMILWGLSAEIYRRYREQFLPPEIEEKGYTYLSKGYKINLAFLESLRNRNVYIAIRDSGIPTLLVHGNADTTASVDLARTCHKLAPDNTTLYEVDGGNHGFKAQPAQLSEAINASLSWITAK